MKKLYMENYSNNYKTIYLSKEKHMDFFTNIQVYFLNLKTLSSSQSVTSEPDIIYVT